MRLFKPTFHVLIHKARNKVIITKLDAESEIGMLSVNSNPLALVPHNFHRVHKMPVKVCDNLLDAAHVQRPLIKRVDLDLRSGDKLELVGMGNDFFHFATPFMSFSFSIILSMQPSISSRPS